MYFTILKVFLFFFFLYYVFYDSTVKLGEGIKIPIEPQQKNLKVEEVFKFQDNFILTKKATYEIEAKILAKENYYFDSNSKIVPIDLALGWKEMSDEKNLENISITQGNRWYYWMARNSKISLKQIELLSANHHIIPSNEEILEELENIEEGELVKLEGFLVDIYNEKEKQTYKTSLSRNDVGSGACEIVFVTKIQKIIK